MSTFNKQNSLWRAIWRADSYVSSTVFEVVDGARRAASAYSSFLHLFRLSGLRRIAADLLDDGLTFVAIALFAVLAYALPPFTETGDVWNRGRSYAVTFTDAGGKIIGRRGIRQDDNIPLSDMPPHVIKAVLATEDARFYQHFGVDILGTLRAMRENARAHEVVQGGSSITQQVAKNLFLSPERTIRRKIHEAFFALWIEARLTKDEILKLYLDRSYLGAGNYGVEAAAQYYFGKSIRDVNLSEAAMLAGLFKAPSKYAPHVNLEAAKARANTVLYRMLDARFITQGDYLRARREPAQIVHQDNIDAPDWYLDWAYKDTLAIIEDQHLTGDYVIEVKTPIDTRIQTAAQQIINNDVDTQAPAFNATQAAAVVMEQDGAVKAIVGGRNYEESKFNRATDALRQPGSSFKPFVYLTALLNGYTPKSVVIDQPISVGNWSPRNYSGKFVGRTTLINALTHSFNSIPVQLMLKVGRKAIIETAHLAGIQGELENWPPMVLGTSAMTLIDLTTGYATFAAGGRMASPYTVLEIRRPNGEVLYSREKSEPPPEQTLPEEKVAELNTMLNSVVVNGTGRRAFLGFTPQGGKTGTNQSYRDAWFVGFTAHYVTGVWYGNDDFTAMNKMTGGLLPAATWKEIMVIAEQGKTAAALPGIPLDESYARYVAENQPKVEEMPVPAPSQTAAADTSAPSKSAAKAITPAKPKSQSKPVKTASKASRGPTRTALQTPPDDDVIIMKSKSQDDPVVGAFKDMFGLFRSDDETAPRQQRARKRIRFLNGNSADSSGGNPELQRLKTRER